MARRAASDSKGLSQWVRSLGEQIGNELGRIIAASVNRTLQSSIDVKGAAAGGRRGRRRSGEKAICSEPGCGNPVLAKGLCRSHYYRERYRAQKSGAARARKAGGGKKARGKKAAKAQVTAPAPAGAGETSAV